MSNRIERLFDRRVRGFRIVEVAALGCFVMTVFFVYMTKASANEERTQISRIERDIDHEQRKLKLLRAETAHLEQPARIEVLSQNYLGLKPVAAKREAQPDGLVEIARNGNAPVRAVAAPVATPAAEAVDALAGAAER